MFDDLYFAEQFHQKSMFNLIHYLFFSIHSVNTIQKIKKKQFYGRIIYQLSFGETLVHNAF